MPTPRQTLTVQLMHATAQIAQLEEQLAALQAQLALRDAPPAPRPPRTLPAHFVAAREAAMRMGRAVLVGT